MLRPVPARSEVPPGGRAWPAAGSGEEGIISLPRGRAGARCSGRPDPAMKLQTERYETQASCWPPTGRHILAYFDDSSIVVYQAYRPSIGRFAVANGKLGGPEFSFSRMSWIKTSFLWMMYRSGWGTKEGQEVTLALRIRRTFF